jgi:hypothetical protein
LAGAAVDADADYIREVENFNRALNLARERCRAWPEPP